MDREKDGAKDDERREGARVREKETWKVKERAPEERDIQKKRETAVDLARLV